MAYSLRPAARSSAKLLIGLYSLSGCGKTWSSLLLARGFVGPTGRIGMIETESGRGEAYADVLDGGYEVISLRESFSPQTYGEAIAVAERAKLDALIVDSASHEWEGVGGVLDMAAKNQEAGRKGPIVWQKPKIDHSREFVLRMMQTPIPLVIVCMRAKYPMMEVVNAGKKEWVRSKDLEPKQSEDMLYEMFAHGWLDEGHRLHITKYPKAIPSFKDILKDGEPITIETGQRLAAWASGKANRKATAPAGHSPVSPSKEAPVAVAPNAAAQEPSGKSPGPAGNVGHMQNSPRGEPVRDVPASAAPDPLRDKLIQGLKVAGSTINAKFNGVLAMHSWKDVADIPDEELAGALKFVNAEIDKKSAREQEKTT